MTNGLREGTINPLDMDSNQKAVLKAVEEQIHTTAARSARAELGQERFQRLESIAAVNPEVAEAVEGYAIHRSLGQHEDSWADFYAEVESFVSGNR